MGREPVRQTIGKPDKAPLYMKLYFQEAYTEVARIVGYGGFPHDRLEEMMKDLVERFGRPKIQEVCGELITLQFNGEKKRSGPKEAAEVRLREEVRKLCWQLLGPPPEKKMDFEKDLVGAPTKVQGPTRAERPAPVKAPPKPKKPRKRKAEAERVADRESAKPRKISPLMKQYREAKEKHPDMILLFRIGDFYEVFDEDAETLHTKLGLTLTTRDQAVSMAGFPHHQLETYLHKLLKAGLRVAVCDQVEDTMARIKHEVKRVIVPGEDDATAEEPA